jgi:hypothetical protein
VSENKRPAYEPATRLLERTHHDPNMPRPLSTVAGAAIVLLRVVAGVVWLAALAVEWPHLVETGEVQLEDAVMVGPDTVSGGLLLVLVIGGIGLAIEALLAVLIYRGVNWARVVVMGYAVVSICTSFAAWWAEGQEITIATTFVTLALDILVLLALSSRDAAAYARRNEGT